MKVCCKLVYLLEENHNLHVLVFINLFTYLPLFLFFIILSNINFFSFFFFFKLFSLFTSIHACHYKYYVVKLYSDN